MDICKYCNGEGGLWVNDEAGLRWDPCFCPTLGKIDPANELSQKLAAVLPHGPFHVISHKTEYPKDGPVVVEEVQVQEVKLTPLKMDPRACLHQLVIPKSYEEDICISCGETIRKLIHP